MTSAVARLSFLLAGLFVTGCTETPAKIADGCYRFSDGQPLLRIEGSKGTFVAPATIASFKIEGRDRKNRQDFEVTPAFLIHDGTSSAPRGPARMVDVVTTIPSGTLRYQHKDGKDVLLIPLEAFGEDEVFRGGRC